jgi:lauroyl/myristoyl acyltransferase
VTHSDPIEVSSSDPAELRRATQAIADALAATIAAAPEQWYSFKPIWPSTPAEQAALAERAGTAERAATADTSGALAPAGG